MGEIDMRTDGRIGTRLANRYRIDERIDTGGMATVYKATDEILGRYVAVKIMHPALASDPSFVERFRIEGQNAARLSHSNIVTVYDYGESGGDLFMIMELVEGTNLRSLLEKFGHLDPPTTRHVALGVAAALDHAHSKGIVHRDVKPENVLLTPDGQVKVVDFGIAKALRGARATNDRPIGTVAYVAPEQITSADVDGRADVYAFGAMTYEMLTGRTPFNGDTPHAVAVARLREPVLSPGISPQINAAVAKATSLQPDARFATPGEFARALGEGGTPFFQADPSLLTTDNLPAALPVTSEGVAVLPFQARLRNRKRRRFRTYLAAVAVLVVVAVIAYAVMPKPTSIPDLRAQTLAEAKSAVEREGLKVGDITGIYHDVAAEGTIVGSDPDPGTDVKNGTEITLIVSKGAQLFDVPEIVGKPIDEAKQAMARAGFSLSVEKEDFNDTVPKGAVASYGPDRERAKRGTSFTAVVSKGPSLVAVPNVTGKAPPSARAALEAAKFTYVEASEYSSTVELGRVIRTDPGGGVMAPKGSKVTTYVSKGPRPFPMPDLVGMTLGAAKEKARSLGLVVANEYAVPGSGKPKGTVQGQNPPTGSSVRKGTPIDLYYAQ